MTAKRLPQCLHWLFWEVEAAKMLDFLVNLDMRLFKEALIQSDPQWQGRDVVSRYGSSVEVTVGRAKYSILWRNISKDLVILLRSNQDLRLQGLKNVCQIATVLANMALGVESSKAENNPVVRFR